MNPKRTLAFLVLITVLFSSFASPAGMITAQAAGNTALSFNGTNQYVTFGTGTSLNAANFTIEVWFNRQGAGTGVTTGSGGVASAIPLLTKGTSESEAANLDINYFLGIDATTGVLIADFEEGTGGAKLSQNHPVSGTTAVANNTWNHAAATYDGTTLKLYLNGQLEASTVIGQPAAAATTSPAALGSSIKSTGAAQGFFQGYLDEARIWNVAHTQAEIQAAKDQEVTSGTGLLARWGMNESSGAIIASSVGSFNGTLMPSATPPTWVSGFPVVDITPPAAPTGLVATPGDTFVALRWTPNAEGDLAGYNVYRRASGSGTFTKINTSLVTSAYYVDQGLANGTGYDYNVKAVDTGSRESTASANVTASAHDSQSGLSFNGSNQYVTFGTGASLDAANFTVEIWFYRQGAGTGVTTGTGGIASAIPLLAKGTSESEAANVDINYFLGIDAATGVLIADFEEGAGGTAPSQNHPISGTTVIANNTWNHAAATYDGTTFKLYLNGQLQASSAISQPAASATNSPVTIGSSLKSDGTTAQGFFHGYLDEARIWNVARTQAEIQSGLGLEYNAAATSLIARWGMDEGQGGYLHDAYSSSLRGTLMPAATPPVFVSGFVYTPPDTNPPAQPTGLTAEPGSKTVGLKWNANTEPDLAGYNLYRGTTSGSYGADPINASLITSTEYVDTGLTNGTTYYYVLKAVDSASRVSVASAQVSAKPDASYGTALEFHSAQQQYVSLGLAPALNSSVFTIETWFKRQGAGVTTNTGTNGVVAVPLIAKGRHEQDGSNVDLNYFLGIDPATNLLAADFEDTANGGNHSVYGKTALPANDTWHHVAATYNGTSWALYLDGSLETTLVVNATPRSDSIEHAALGSTLDSKTSEVAEGYFDGVLDEVRIWNVARTQAEIQASRFMEVTSASGLIGRWGMNEGSGTTIADSVGGTIGTLVKNPSWVAGFPQTPDATPPAKPNGLTATPGNMLISLSWTANTEPDLAGYNVYRSTTTPVPLTNPINENALVVGASYVDSGLTNGTLYYYAIVAVDSSSNKSAGSAEVSASPLATAGSAIDFGGTDAYVDFGNPAKLHLDTFTIETWFRRDGTGKTTTTGTDGLQAGEPLVSRGRGESEDPNVDLNYFLGIDASKNVLAADFEEKVTVTGSSPNHPVYGTTTITNGVWHHAAATYDGVTWRLYLDGVLDGQAVVNKAPASQGNQYASIGSGLTSTGVADGFFNGVIDEARIWNRALPETEIRTNMNQQLTTGSGLVARWGLNEGSGTSVSDSLAAPVSGTIKGSAYTWAPGAPFNASLAPGQPTLVTPANGATNVSTSPTLTINVSDPDSASLTVTFYGRPMASAAGDNFTLVAIPDTQSYTNVAGRDAIFNAETQWVVNNQAAQKIAFVTHLGDITENGDNDTTEAQWKIAQTAMGFLKRGAGAADDVPYSVVAGNHDVAGGTTLFNKYFGPAQFTGLSYYGGAWGSDQTSTYSLFSAGGMNFILLNLTCTDTAPAAGMLTWADNLLKANANRQAIVNCHTLFSNSTSLSSVGSAVLNALKGNSNLFLMLGGHVPGEGRRTDLGTDGHTIYSLMADYQSRTNGGDGWIRLMEFQPANNLIGVKTYSPKLNQYETDADSQFTLSYNMMPGFAQIGAPVTVSSGSNASVTWSGLAGGMQYEWYAVVSDGAQSTQSTTWNFTTSGAANRAPVCSGGSATTAEDTVKEVSPSCTDADTADVLSYSIVANPTNGTATVLAGKLVYTPSANFNGNDSFTYKANDGKVDSNVVTMAITVTAVNDAPVCADSTYTTDEDVTGNPLASCTDVDGDPVNLSVATQPGKGTAAVIAGKLTYGPAADVNGTDSFTYLGTDGKANSAPATINITINPVNDKPVCSAVSLTTNKNVASQVTLACTDVDGDILTPLAATQPAHGTASVSSGKLIYTPEKDYAGQDSFTYKTTDGKLESSAVMVTVTIINNNNLPVCSAVNLTVTKGRSGETAPMCSDSDSDSLTYTIVVQPAHGTASVSNGKLIYTPSENFSGMDSFTYQANDGQGDSTAVQISVVVTDSANIYLPITIH